MHVAAGMKMYKMDAANAGRTSPCDRAPFCRPVHPAIFLGQYFSASFDLSGLSSQSKNDVIFSWVVVPHCVPQARSTVFSYSDDYFDRDLRVAIVTVEMKGTFYPKLLSERGHRK